jgi:two-component system, NarL family, response regulator NreC
MSKIRVLLTDDHTLFRQGIRTLLLAEDDMEIAGEASSGAEAVELAAKARPDVALMDIGMPGMSSFEAARLIRKHRPETRIVFLSMYDDEEYLAECVEMGANGYILKDSPADQLVTAIREAHRGGSSLSPRMLSKLVDDFRNPGASRLRGRERNTLTTREREILKMLAEGKSSKELAAEFKVSVKTIEVHKFNLMRKLNIHNRAQLVQYAIQRKLVKVPELVN